MTMMPSRGESTMKDMKEWKWQWMVIAIASAVGAVIGFFFGLRGGR